MILVIRIAGRVQNPTPIDETLYRMRLHKKYVATLLDDTPENRKLLEKVRNYVAYGEISQEMLQKLIEARGQFTNKKPVDSEKAAKLLQTKGFEESGLKPFFRLHPPRKGIDSKKHFGIAKGVLGNNKEAINQLVERML